MNLLDKLKRFLSPQERLEAPESNQNNPNNQNMYEQLGILNPFTVLADTQFNYFIRALSKSTLLNNAEREAFEELWYAACRNLDGEGNSIFNLKKGCFEIFKKDDVVVKYEKKKAEVKNKWLDSELDGRANFVYLSKAGNFIIHQDDRNNKVFMVYVSENISDRLLDALSEAELEALDLELIPESNHARKRVGIPKSLDNAIIDQNGDETIQIIDKKENQSADESKKIEDDERDDR